MKLIPGFRVGLGEGALAFPKPPTVCLRADGSALCITAQRTDVGWETALVHVTTSGEQVRMPVPDGTFGAQPVIVDRGDSGVIVLVDDRTAVAFDGAFESSSIVEIRDRVDAPAREGRVTVGGVARPVDNGMWLVVLSDPGAFQNARTIAQLSVDGSAPAWEAMDLLDGNDYPMAGGRASTAPGGAKAPIIGDAIDMAGTRFVAAQGSDTMSLLRYGSDFFTLAELGADGHVARRVYEERGWKKQPGKHGIRARFTSDGVSAILTPVFQTGAWGGRQRLVGLADGSLDEIAPVRGASKFTLADIRGEHAVLVSDDELLFATT